MQQAVPAKSTHIDGSNLIRVTPLLKKSLTLGDPRLRGSRVSATWFSRGAAQNVTGR
jgi:hypothetical protein